MFYFYPLFLLGALGVIWGSGYTLARFVISNGISPLAYSFWQGLGPVILLLLYNCYRGERYRFNWKHAVTGILGIALPNTNMYFAAANTPAGILAVLVNTVPLFTYLFACLFAIEKITFKKTFAVLLGLIGIYLILNVKLATQSFSIDHLTILFTPICFALTAIFINKYCQEEDNANLACGMLLVATVFIAPIMWFFNGSYLPTYPFANYDWAILLEILLSTIGYIIFFELLKVASAIYYSFVGGIVAITGLFWGWAILNESLHLYQAIGTAVVAIAIILINLKQE